MQIALRYASNGIKIFPCTGDKKPSVIGGNGFKDATTSVKQIEAWWTKYPEALIGAPNDQFVVLDSDDYDLCYVGKTLHELALRRLTEEKIITDAVFTVKTLSGGTHYYFKRDPDSTRLIKCLPFFDLLSNGGYAILPDQKNYIANVEEPWEKITELKKFKSKEFSYLVDELEEATHAAKELKTKRKTEFRKKEAIAKRAVVAMRVVESIGGDLEKTEKTSIYKATENQYTKPDHLERLLIDGKFPLNDGKLNSILINRLFYNREVQQKIAEFMGLKKTEDRALQRSIFPHHEDRRPSMGIRWSADGSHIIVRDFSMFYSKPDQCDYDLVRLFASIQYGKAVSLSKTEFVVWFTRLMVDSGILSINIKSIPTEIKLSKSEVRILSGLYLLDACKSLYDGYCGETTFSVKFASAWIGHSVGNSISKVKSSLVQKGLIEITGEYDCGDGKRTDGFYNTKLLKVVDKLTSDKSYKDTILVKIKAIKDMFKTTKKTEGDVKKKYPDLGTLYSLKISETSYAILKNFCEDFDIPNIPDRIYMHVPVLVSDDFIADVLEDPQKQFLVNDLTLFEVESDGRRMLMCQGHSKAYEELWHSVHDKHGQRRDDYMDDPIPAFVISSDLGDGDFDLNSLEIRLNEFINPAVVMTDFRTTYLNNERIDDELDGLAPEI